MLTKEECVKQLENIRKEITMAYTDVCYDKATKISMSEREHSVYLSCNKLERLIKEHFDNPPLKFEELEGDMWVWDNVKKDYKKIYSCTYNDCGNYVIFRHDVLGDDWDYFEENRFYRYEVKE